MLRCWTIDKSSFSVFNLFTYKYVTNYLVFIYLPIYLCILMFKELPRHRYAKGFQRKMYTNVRSLEKAQGWVFWKTTYFERMFQLQVKTKVQFIFKPLIATQRRSRECPTSQGFFLWRSSCFSVVLMEQFTQVWHFVYWLHRCHSVFVVRNKHFQVSCDGETKPCDWRLQSCRNAALN